MTLDTTKILKADDILVLKQRYEPFHTPIWGKMQTWQNLLDRNYNVLTKPIEGVPEYKSSRPFADIEKLTQRVVATEPHIEIKPQGKGEVAKRVAEDLENQVHIWIRDIVASSNRAVWTALAYFANARGKAVRRGVIVTPGYEKGEPEQGEGESEEGYARRRARWRSARRKLNPFLCEAVDPMYQVIHPPTTMTVPPWALRVAEMDVYEVMEKFPWWHDPKEKRAQKGQVVELIEYVSPVQITLLADGETVSRYEGQAGAVPNPYGRVYYELLFSGKGYPGSKGITNRTLEEMLAVGVLAPVVGDIDLENVMMTAARAYCGRWVDPSFTGTVDIQTFRRQQANGYFPHAPGQDPVKLMVQPELPNYILQLIQQAISTREYVTLPSAAVGVQVPGVSSGIQLARMQSQIDLGVIALRNSIERAMEETIVEACYAVKYVMDEETAARACPHIKPEDVPDAPEVKVTLEPPDLEARARKSAIAEQVRDTLDPETLLAEHGYENPAEILRKRRAWEDAQAPEIRQLRVQWAMELFGILRAEFEAKEAGRMPGVAMMTPAPSPGNGAQPEVPGVPTPAPAEGSPEQIQRQLEAELQIGAV